MSNVGIIPKSSYRQTHSRRTAQPDHQNTATEQRRFLEMFSRPTCSFCINFVPRVFVQLAVGCGQLCNAVCSWPFYDLFYVYRQQAVRQKRAKTAEHVKMSVRRCRERKCAENYNKCADTIGTVPVPWASHFECQNINIFFFK